MDNGWLDIASGADAEWRFSSPSLPVERDARSGSMDRAGVDCMEGIEEVDDVRRKRTAWEGQRKRGEAGARV